jgi:hypothetical protein
MYPCEHLRRPIGIDYLTSACASPCPLVHFPPCLRFDNPPFVVPFISQPYCIFPSVTYEEQFMLQEWIIRLAGC